MRKIKISVNGKPYEVELGDLAATPLSVVVNGKAYSVEVEADSLTPRVSLAPQAASARSASSSPAAASKPPVANTRPDGPREHSASGAQPIMKAAAPGAVIAPMPGKILAIKVAVGDKVAYGNELLVLEAMKMENVIRAQGTGVVKEIKVTPGQSVSYGEALIIIE